MARFLQKKSELEAKIEAYRDEQLADIHAVRLILLHDHSVS